MTYNKQNTNGACGATAIRNALKFFGENHSERKIRELAGTTKDGTTARQIIKALGRLGYEAKSYIHKKEEPFKNRLIKVLKGGTAIVLVDHMEHWITILEYKEHKLRIADSDCGLRKTVYPYDIATLLIRARNVNKENPKKEKIFYNLIEVKK